MYNGLFGSDELAWLLRQQLVNRGVCHPGSCETRYQVEGCRCSGDMNTSLGNCLIMCCLVLHLVRTLGVRADLANNGDDCLLFLEHADEAVVRAAIPAFFLNFGFQMVVEPTSEVFERCEFRQMRRL